MDICEEQIWLCQIKAMQIYGFVKSVHTNKDFDTCWTMVVSLEHTDLAILSHSVDTK